MMCRIRLFTLLFSFAITQSAFSLHPHAQRQLALGKWNDAPATQVDCSNSSHNYEYFIEKCYDATTMWWINGHCINGEKEEFAELHKCLMPNGDRKYCHDCLDPNTGSGQVKNVCGADSPDKDLVCEIAFSDDDPVDYCDSKKKSMSVYTHQCVVDDPTKTLSWYTREDIDCYDKEKYTNGPNMENTIPQWTCGKQWYFEFSEDYLEDVFDGDLHPFANEENKYCLDCGWGMQVCASSTEATCASLGLPERGVEFTSTIAPWIAPDPLYTTYPTMTHNPTKALTTAAPQKQEAVANAPTPTIAVPKEPPLGSIVTAEPSYVPTAGEDSQGKAPSSASTTLKSRRLFIGVVVGVWTSYAVVLM